jgi:pantothenate kinase-related protein Tda10
MDSDAEYPLYVYDWRLQQEAALRAAKGRGMTDDQVVHFVNGCKSCYPKLGTPHIVAEAQTRLSCI